MCFNSGGTNNAAVYQQRFEDLQARADEVARQARIERGRRQIDALFDRGETLQSGGEISTRPDTPPEYVGVTPPSTAQIGIVADTTPEVYAKTQPAFDDAFYDARRQAYLGNYMPQLAQKFQEARDNLSFALAKAGLTRSSVAADKVARLNEDNTVQAGTIASKAEDDVNKVRSSVEDSRANLVAQLQASADPGGTANLALARSQVMQKQPVEYSPLGDVFSGIATGIGRFVQGAQYASLYGRTPGGAQSPSGGTTQGTRTGQ